MPSYIKIICGKLFLAISFHIVGIAVFVRLNINLPLLFV